MRRLVALIVIAGRTAVGASLGVSLIVADLADDDDWLHGFFVGVGIVTLVLAAVSLLQLVLVVRGRPLGRTVTVVLEVAQLALWIALAVADGAHWALTLLIACSVVVIATTVGRSDGADRVAQPQRLGAGAVGDVGPR